MKHQFKNQHANGISKPMREVRDIFFSVSTFGSAICIAAIIASYVDPGSSITSNPLLWVPAVIIAGIVATIVDFKIIRKIGKFAITELIAWTSGQFYTPIQRKINTILFLSIVCFGVFVSFTTSFDGSRIAAGMAPAISPGVSIGESVKSEREIVLKSLSPYKQAVNDIEKKITSETSVRTSGELKRLSSGGNQWAKNEIIRIGEKVNAKYLKELNAAKSALQAAELRENNRADKVIQETEQTVTKTNAANQERTGIIWWMLTSLGVLPLIFGVFLLIADCNNTVMMQIPKQQQQPKSESGAGQRSDTFENIYANP